MACLLLRFCLPVVTGIREVFKLLDINFVIHSWEHGHRERHVCVRQLGYLFLLLIELNRLPLLHVELLLLLNVLLLNLLLLFLVLLIDLIDE